MLEFIAGGAVGALLSGGNTHQKTTTLVPYEKTVHEHRAPTDESISLLREMEEKSRKQIAFALVSEDNVVNGAVVQFYDDPMGFGKVCYVSFMFNGRKCEGKFNHDGRVALTKRQAVHGLIDAVSKEVMRLLLADVSWDDVR